MACTVTSVVGLSASELSNIQNLNPNLDQVVDACTITVEGVVGSISQQQIGSSVSPLIIFKSFETAVPIIYSYSVKFKELAFTLSDWILSDSKYYIPLIHNFNKLTVLNSVFRSNGIEVELEVKPESLNETRFYLPADPDLRFSGTLFVYIPYSGT